MNAQSGIVKLPEESYEAAIRRFARGGAHIAGDDKTNPWVPFGEAAAIKHFCFDVRANSVANILWVKGGGRIGTHKHRGIVSAVTLEGSWAYHEYERGCEHQRSRVGGRLQGQQHLLKDAAGVAAGLARPEVQLELYD